MKNKNKSKINFTQFLIRVNETIFKSYFNGESLSSQGHTRSLPYKTFYLKKYFFKKMKQKTCPLTQKCNRCNGRQKDNFLKIFKYAKEKACRKGKNQVLSQKQN